MRVLVAGGDGCVGRALCRALTDRGHTVTAASRTPDPAVLPDGAATARLDVTEPDLTDVVAGHDAVVNLVALPSHREPRGRGHDAVHRGGTAHLVAAAEDAGVDRFVQLSALGVDEDVDTAYFRAKRAAEDVVRESALPWVIYRPSVVVGDGCAFLPFLRRLAAARVVPLPDGGALRIQPLWSRDLAGMLASGVEDEEHVEATYRLGGPERLALRDVVGLVAPEARIVALPPSLAAIGFGIADRLPGVPFGRDQLRVFALDNVVDDDDTAAFGVAEDDLRRLEDLLEER